MITVSHRMEAITRTELNNRQDEILDAVDELLGHWGAAGVLTTKLDGLLTELTNTAYRCGYMASQVEHRVTKVCSESKPTKALALVDPGERHTDLPTITDVHGTTWRRYHDKGGKNWWATGLGWKSLEDIQVGVEA